MVDPKFKFCQSHILIQDDVSRVVQWSKALHYSASCVTTDPGSVPGCVAASRYRETHEAAHVWPSVFRVRGGFGRPMSLSHRSSESCGGPGTLTRSPAGRRFLQYIGAAGYWVKGALCQEAVLLGRIVFQRMQGS